MNVDITINKNTGLLTLVPSLMAQQIHSRISDWYKDDAILYADSLLIDDHETGKKIKDPDCDYLSGDATEFANKYILLFQTSQKNNDLENLKLAHGICCLLLNSCFLMNSEIRKKLFKVQNYIFDR